MPKFRISRFLPSFQTCRSSKHTSSLPPNPIPSLLSLTPLNPKLFHFHFSSKSHRSSLRRQVSSAFWSAGGCGFKSWNTVSEDDPSGLHWEKEGKWLEVTKVIEETPRRKIYCPSVSSGSVDDLLPLPPLPRLGKMKRRVRKKKTTSTARISSSSGHSCGMFSSDGCDEERYIDEEETETLVSSCKSFATDFSSECFNPCLEITRKNSANDGRGKKLKQKNIKKRKKKKEEVERSVPVSSPECQSPARLSMFECLIPCGVEGKVRESFAVVKKSEDPYEDFRKSMMEMILEKQMFEEQELEQLLHCFLSLNSCQHHDVIVEAFSEIWEALYSYKTD